MERPQRIQEENNKIGYAHINRKDRVKPPNGNGNVDVDILAPYPTAKPGTADDVCTKRSRLPITGETYEDTIMELYH